MFERFRRTTHTVPVLAAAVVAIAIGAGEVARAESAHQLEHQLSDAKSRAESARAHEQALAADIAAQSEAIDGVEAELASLSDELETLEGRLSRSRAQLNALRLLQRQKARELVRARRMLGTAQRRLSERIVEIYTADQPDTLAVVLGAESLDELVDRLETQSRVVEYDADLVDQVTTLRARLVRERRRAARLKAEQALRTAAIAKDTNARRATYPSLVARRDSLTNLRSTRQRSLASVQVERQQWEAQADALAAESTRVASVAVAPSPAPAPASSSPTPASTSSGFVWPVSGSLVSPFGQRWGRLHAGIDIAAPAGTPVVASVAGTVAYAGSMSGYGLIVVIQHASGIATAYAHNSSVAVSVGQAVSQGQTIAAVGCTGHCFGDHVHFEVRVGGNPVDPMGYL